MLTKVERIQKKLQASKVDKLVVRKSAIESLIEALIKSERKVMKLELDALFQGRKK